MEEEGDAEGSKHSSNGSFACGSQLENNYFTELCSGSEAGSYLRFVDFCITECKA